MALMRAQSVLPVSFSGLVMVATILPGVDNNNKILHIATYRADPCTRRSLEPTVPSVFPNPNHETFAPARVRDSGSVGRSNCLFVKTITYSLSPVSSAAIPLPQRGQPEAHPRPGCGPYVAVTRPGRGPYVARMRPGCCHLLPSPLRPPPPQPPVGHAGNTRWKARCPSTPPPAPPPPRTGRAAARTPPRRSISLQARWRAPAGWPR